MGSQPPLTSADQSNHRETGETAVVPRENYILCGRGNVNTRHPGNKKFYRIIQENSSRYIKATSRLEKIVVVTSVVTLLRDCGMKFMTLDEKSNLYVEVAAQRVHEKVSHAIRDCIKQSEKVASRNRKSRMFFSEAKLKAILSGNSKAADSNRKPIINSTKSVVAAANHDSDKKPAAVYSNPSSDFLVREKTTLKPEPRIASTKPLTMDAFALSQPPQVSLTGSEDDGLGYAGIIFDLGEKIEDNKLPLVPYDDDIFSSLSMSPLSDFRDLMQFEDRGLDASCFTLEEETKSDTVPVCRQTIECNDTVRSSSILEPRAPSPLPIDSNADFEEDDLKTISAILLDRSLEAFPLNPTAIA